jgi:hypothetical protein
MEAAAADRGVASGDIQTRVKNFRCPEGFEVVPIPKKFQFRSDIYEYGVKCCEAGTKRMIW